jgi:adenosine deaminase
LSDYLEYIEPLQKKILKILKEKEIAIEIMMSSNTRISYYDKYEDHHIFKWLDKKDIPDLIIATDDPGIFNTNLKNEYLHLYNILSNKYEKSDEYILGLFNTLNNNSNKYSFHNLN